MGLDMYLTTERLISPVIYTGSGESFQANPNPQFHAITAALGLEDKVDEKSFTGYIIDVPIGYWRKANAIHGHIIKTYADGVDECQKVWLSRESLQEILDVCKRVKEGGEMSARELLPPVEGCFFGSYEIDEYYWSDIDRTIEVLTRALDDEWLSSATYQASW